MWWRCRVMREEFFIERQGRKFVLYSGLLDEAHQRGLRSIETELLQVPTSENGEVAIARAVVRTEEGKFTGIGDASPQNVGRAIAPHVIRMAETRAKARALRDAINVGVTAFEELGEGDEQEARQGQPATTRQPQQQRQQRRTEPESPDEGREEVPREEMPATRKQLNYLEALISDTVEDGLVRFEEMVGKPVGRLTRAEASEWIGRLSGRAA
jgi:hypothetical protein